MLSISFQGYMSLELLKVSFAAFGIHVLFFLLLYTLTVFSMIMTGKLLIDSLSHSAFFHTELLLLHFSDYWRCAFSLHIFEGRRLLV